MKLRYLLLKLAFCLIFSRQVDAKHKYHKTTAPGEKKEVEPAKVATEEKSVVEEEPQVQECEKSALELDVDVAARVEIGENEAVPEELIKKPLIFLAVAVVIACNVMIIKFCTDKPSQPSSARGNTSRRASFDLSERPSHNKSSKSSASPIEDPSSNPLSHLKPHSFKPNIVPDPSVPKPVIIMRSKIPLPPNPGPFPRPSRLGLSRPKLGLLKEASQECSFYEEPVAGTSIGWNTKTNGMTDPASVSPIIGWRPVDQAGNSNVNPLADPATISRTSGLKPEVLRPKSNERKKSF